MTADTLRPGLRGAARMTVTGADTATALGSGDVPVLATPRVIALIEAAAVAALRDALPEKMTSVGTEIDVRHVAPSAIGTTVEAEAIVEAASEREVRFRVRAWDVEKGADVARGGHARAIVDRERFLRRVTNEA